MEILGNDEILPWVKLDTSKMAEVLQDINIKGITGEVSEEEVELAKKLEMQGPQIEQPKTLSVEQQVAMMSAQAMREINSKENIRWIQCPYG